MIGTKPLALGALDLRTQPARVRHLGPEVHVLLINVPGRIRVGDFRRFARNSIQGPGWMELEPSRTMVDQQMADSQPRRSVAAEARGGWRRVAAETRGAEARCG